MTLTYSPWPKWHIRTWLDCIIFGKLPSRAGLSNSGPYRPLSCLFYLFHFSNTPDWMVELPCHVLHKSWLIQIRCVGAEKNILNLQNSGPRGPLDTPVPEEGNHDIATQYSPENLSCALILLYVLNLPQFFWTTLECRYALSSCHGNTMLLPQ